MTDVRIICTHDAAKLAETLTRLLEAEQHRVRLTIGRQAMGELEFARSAADAVMLIWSPDARSQTYMLEWAQHIAPHRLVELTLTDDYPKLGRKAAQAIDYSHWRGTRGTSQWNALNDRLRAVQRALNPPKPPPKYAAFALGMASAAAVTGAIVMRVNDTSLPVAGADSITQEALVAGDPATGLGGPLSAVEPASVDDDLHFRRLPNAALLQPGSYAALARVPGPVDIELREETLLERLNAFNPLRQLDNNES
jgi:hypothetical protein